MSATWLADVLRAAGCAVDESLVPDWKSRGHTDGPFAPVGVLGHHTAGPASGDLPSFGVVRDGRPDLAGPLSNLMLSRAGVWVPIAAGRCWHAGGPDDAGHWPWVPNGDGNGYLIGIEAESAGTGDWTAEQVAAYPHGVAALLAHMGAGPDHFLGHLEWAPSRKIDPAGWPGGMGGFRAAIATGGEDMPLNDDDLRRLHNAVWFGAPGATLLPNEAAGKPIGQGEWANTTLGSMTARIARDIVEPAVAELEKKIQAGTTAPVNVDAAQVASALAGNAQFLQALAKAVNDDAARRLAS